MKSAILTGGTGFIGSWLIEELLAAEVDVTLIVRDKYRVLPKFIPSVEIIESDTYNIPTSVFNRKRYDVFYHLGWGGVKPKEKNNVELQFGNIKNSIEAMQLAKGLNCCKFIASGTVAEYVFSKDILDVNAKQTPNDMYGASKVASHYFLDVLSKQIEQPFIWAVLPSTYGERRNDDNIITYTICSLLQGKKPIYGNLEQMWDFLYASDVAYALKRIGEDGIIGKTYGIGSNIYKPLKWYIMKIRDVIDPNLPLGIGEASNYSQQTLSSCVNAYELIKDTGFTPKVDFELGIKKTIKYFEEKIVKGIKIL